MAPATAKGRHSKSPPVALREKTERKTSPNSG
jgi:hypothetical protein